MTQKTQSGKQLFRLSQKVLFYSKEKNAFLLLKIAELEEHKPHYILWRKKYGLWDLPGGHVDFQENDLEAALSREIYEETGIENFQIDGICTRVTLPNELASHPAIHIIFRATYDGEVNLSAEHQEYCWMTAEDIAKNKEVNKWIKNAVVQAEGQMEQEQSLERWKRCMADFDNYKKRQAESQKEFVAYASEGVISDMLPVVDNFHAATDHIPETEKDNPWVTGIMYIQQQMEKIFEEKGVTRMDIKIGDDFDPHIMEAVMSDEKQMLSEDAKVIKIAQPGYKIGTKVLRPARVVLGVIE